MRKQYYLKKALRPLKVAVLPGEMPNRSAIVRERYTKPGSNVPPPDGRGFRFVVRFRAVFDPQNPEFRVIR